MDNRQREWHDWNIPKWSHERKENSKGINQENTLGKYLTERRRTKEIDIVDNVSVCKERKRTNTYMYNITLFSLMA